MCLGWLCKHCCGGEDEKFDEHDPTDQQRRLDYIALHGKDGPSKEQKPMTMNEMRNAVNKKAAEAIAVREAKPPKQLTLEEKEEKERMERVSKMSIRNYDKQERERCVTRLTAGIQFHHERLFEGGFCGTRIRPRAETLIEENCLLTEELAFKKILREEGMDVALEERKAREARLLPGMRRNAGGTTFKPKFSTTNAVVPAAVMC